MSLVGDQLDMIEVSWYDSDPNIEPKVNGYLVEWRDHNSGIPVGNHLVSSGGSTSYTIRNLLPSTYYDVTVTTRTTDQIVYSDDNMKSIGTSKINLVPFFNWVIQVKISYFRFYISYFDFLIVY